MLAVKRQALIGYVSRPGRICQLRVWIGEPELSLWAAAGNAARKRKLQGAQAEDGPENRGIGWWSGSSCRTTGRTIVLGGWFLTRLVPRTVVKKVHGVLDTVS